MATRKELHKVFDWLLDGKSVQLRSIKENEWSELVPGLFNAEALMDMHNGLEYEFRLKPIEWKVGEKVWDYDLNEWGKIKNIDFDYETPLLVTFNDGGYNRYTIEGKEIEGSKNQVLFKKEMKLVEK